MLLDEIADLVDFVVPAGSADDHILAGLHAGFDISQDAVRGGEVDDGVDVAKLFWS